LILTSFSWSTNFAIQSRFSIFGPHIDYGRSISARFVSFSWSPLSCNLSLPTFGPHIDHGEYMSARHVSYDLDLILIVY
jgi:hypothetical protein